MSDKTQKDKPAVKNQPPVYNIDIVHNVDSRNNSINTVYVKTDVVSLTENILITEKALCYINMITTR